MTDNGIRFVRASGREPYRQIMNSKPVQDLLLKKAERVGLKALNEVSKISYTHTEDKYKHAVKRANYQLTWDVKPGLNRAHAMVKLNVRNPHSFYEQGHARKWGVFVNDVLIRALDSLGGE